MRVRGREATASVGRHPTKPTVRLELPAEFHAEPWGKLISTIIDEEADECEPTPLRADGDRAAEQVAAVSNAAGGPRAVRNRTEHEHE